LTQALFNAANARIRGAEWEIEARDLGIIPRGTGPLSVRWLWPAFAYVDPLDEEFRHVHVIVFYECHVAS